MNLLSIIAILFLLSYLMLMLYFRIGWKKTKLFLSTENYSPSTSVSIIIPARNEAMNIEKLLLCIKNQLYPESLIEVVVIDDHSTDKTAEIVKKFPNVKLISLANFTQQKHINAYKKKAISIGIEQSKNDLIITTDADCSMNKNWLMSIVQYFEKTKCHLIAAPVSFLESKNWFKIFQSIDFCMMQGVTAALSYFKNGNMCNGANLCYTRHSFNTVNGFEGIDHIASGDDMMLMYKIEKRFPSQTAYLKSQEAIIYTDSMNNFSDFISQRIRWASKSTKLNDKGTQAILAFIFLCNFLIMLLLFFSFKNIYYLKYFLILLLCKAFIEMILFYPLAKFFKKKHELIYLFLLQIIHIPYILVSATLSQISSYQWKGRNVK